MRVEILEMPGSIEKPVPGGGRTCSHSKLKSEDLPTLGRPTIPILRLLRTRPKRAAVLLLGASSFLGAIFAFCKRWYNARDAR